ncbi:olfactory receptor 1500-like [Cheilinus undulatus]|uniref:olfactory receptor 1500-like n=1 Tax=Cheilinus undulatus TaxID=241271 RepID=UPI001BD4088C|nr:olfactory receptor 1500-like [Cheilinus undulatus]
MTNSTQVFYFVLIAYFDTGVFKYVCVLVVLLLYSLILCFNLLLIVLICTDRGLQEPMYLFLCSLFANELYGSTALFPFLVLQILSDVHTISPSWCFLQIFCLYSYGKVEFYCLTVISFDRYLAICFPLHYNRHMTITRAVILIVLIWVISFVLNAFAFMLLVPLQLCGNIMNKVYCVSTSITKLACSETPVVNIFGLLVSSVSIYLPFLVIVYTYIQIFRVCFSGSKQTRQKVFSTCTPHLASLINFSFGVCFEILGGRFNMNTVPSMLRIFLSLYFLTCPPLLNPLMYGLNLSKIRLKCKSLMSK